MKKIILIGLITFLCFACQKQRYTQDSPEIETIKAVLTHYDYQNWDSLVTHYADTAKIFHNTRTNILSPTGLADYFKANDANFSTRAFEDENREYEMVIDDNGKKWVNFWGLWKGNLAANNKEIVIPVHITAQFLDGKIVQEYGYWDSSELALELEYIAMKQVQDASTEEDSETEE